MVQQSLVLSSEPAEILKTMREEDLLAALLDLAERLGIAVRQEPLGGEGGGLCQLRGKSVLFVDTSATFAEQLARTAEGLADVPGLEDCFVLPEVREVLERYGRQ